MDNFRQTDHMKQVELSNAAEAKDVRSDRLWRIITTAGVALLFHFWIFGEYWIRFASSHFETTTAGAVFGAVVVLTGMLAVALGVWRIRRITRRRKARIKLLASRFVSPAASTEENERP
jgi:uncharacterized membrane protein YcjF (UPF0283 family)